MTAETNQKRVEAVWDSIAGGMELECSEYDDEEAHRTIAAAITAAVEEERKRWVRAVLDRDKLNDDWVKGLKLEAEEAALAAVEKREKELIPLVCPAKGDVSHWADGCGDGDVPVRRDPQRHTKCNWWHVVSDGLAWPCPASPLHESIHQRGPAAAEGD